MSHLAITLFGTFWFTLDERPIRFATDKCRALLGYLVVEASRPHRREVLAALFWPDQPEKVARTNLRQTLHRLRSAIGDIDDPNPHLLVSTHDIQLNPAGHHRLDVANFERHLAVYRAHCARGLPLCTHCQEALKAAVAFYRGEFMAGFSLPGSPPFELWLLARQEEYHRQALEVFGRLGAFYEETDAFGRAAECARRMVALEPWRESSHRLLMRNLAQAGQDRAALAQYEHCRQLLAEELGIEPSAATRRLYELIRDEAVTERRGKGYTGTTFTHSAPQPFPQWERRSSTLFVGREGELAKLDAHMTRVLAGRGRVLFISGEAGSGKTTLAAEFCRRVMAAEDMLLVTYGRCDGQYGLGDPYQPFREALRLLSGQTGGDLDWLDAEKMAAQRLQAANLAIKQALAEAGPDLTGTLLPDTNNAGQHPVRFEQAALFEQVAGVLRAVAQRRPLILFLDDLHWLDVASASLLFHLGRHLTGSRILIVGAYRPEEVDWSEPGTQEMSRHALLPVVNGLQRLYGDIHIDLDQADGRAFVEAFIDSEPNRLKEGFRASLYNRTDGNPLFTVEMLREMQDRGELVKDGEGCWTIGRDLDWDRLPARVEAVIVERFDRLTSRCRATLAAAGVQGQTFLADVAAEVQGNKAEPVLRCLSEVLGQQHHLVEAESREHYGDRAVSRYRFRHHLFQQFAYQQLDNVARSRLHEATGLVLEALYADRGGEHALELARHFEAAGLLDKAVDYLHQAGKEAYRISANQVAIDCFGRALDLLSECPPGPKRDRTEMMLHLARTAPLLAMRGYTAPEIQEAANRVIYLSKKIDEPDCLFPARMLLLTHYAMLAEYQPGLALAEQLLKQAESEQNPLHLIQAHHFLGYLNFCGGSFEAALNNFNSALTSYDTQVESHLMTGFIGRNMWLTTLFRKAWTLWFLGYPDQSLAALEETMIKVEQFGHDHDLAFTLAVGICPLLYLRHEFDQAEVQAKRLLRLASSKSLHYFIPFGRVNLGSVLVKRGRTVEGQNEIRTGIRQYRESGQKTFLSFCLSILAWSLGGDEEAGKVLDEAMVLVEETGEWFFEAELYRLRGEFLRQKGADPAQVEGCYLQALDLARRQQAKSLELRAATSLARMWQQQGQVEEARTVLVGVYGWFIEGFETRDLQEAQTLLVELDSS